MQVTPAACAMLVVRVLVCGIEDASDPFRLSKMIPGAAERQRRSLELSNS